MQWLKSFFSCLTLYHTIPTYNDPRVMITLLKRKKCCLSAFSRFPTMFSNLPTTNFNFLVTLILSSANTLNWDRSDILSFGSELKDIFVWIQFSTLPVQKSKCITGAVYSTAYFPLSIFFYCASDSTHFSFSTEIPSRIRPFKNEVAVRIGRIFRPGYSTRLISVRITYPRS